MAVHAVSKCANLPFLLSIYANFMIAASHLDELGFAQVVTAKDSQDKFYARPTEAQITRPPILAQQVADFGGKRDESVLCPGYSIVGNKYPCTSLDPTFRL